MHLIYAFLCVRSKSQILRVKIVKKKNLTHPRAAKLATLYACTFNDDACLKELIFLKKLLAVANSCNLRFFCKYICVHGYD